MTDPVAATSKTAAPVRAAAARAARPRGASFAEVHIAAVNDATTKAKSTGVAKSAIRAPKGERTEAVAGHHYAEIISGPRNGMYLNNSGNTRDGQAFLIVRRDGREFHIYGSGKDRAVYEVGRHRDTTSGSAKTGSGSGTTGSTGSASTGTGGSPASGGGTSIT